MDIVAKFSQEEVSDEELLAVVRDLNDRVSQRSDIWELLNLRSSLPWSTPLWPRDTAAQCFEKLMFRVSDMLLESLEKLVKITEPVEGKFYLDASSMGSCITLLIHCYQSLEEPTIRRSCLSLCGLSMWYHLETEYRHWLVTKKMPTLKKYWAKTEKKLTDPSPKLERERDFFWRLVRGYLEVINVKTGKFVDMGGKTQVVDTVLLCERLLELFIDLIDQLPTRRMLLPLISHQCLVVKSQRSFVFNNEEGALFRKLLGLLEYFEFFEIDDDSGDSLPFGQLEHLHYIEIRRLLSKCFELADTLEDQSVIALLKKTALSSISAFCNISSIREFASSLPPAILHVLMKSLLRSNLPEIQNEEDHEFYKDLMEYKLKRRNNALDTINHMPLFPSDDVLWDLNLLPDDDYQGEYALALPKLNLQFLTVHEYLLRNFHLYRMETAYEIREDIQEAIRYLRPRLTPNGKTTADGSHKMIVPLDGFSIVLIKKPNVGEDVPAEVRAEIVIDLGNLKPEARYAWDGLRQFSILFLVGLSPPTMQPYMPLSKNDPSTFPEHAGVIAVRGCEVVEIVDQEGKSMTDPNPFLRHKPIGNVRTIRVMLDPQQYHIDGMSDEAAVSDIYSSFNYVMRRRPEENNFKGVLETIRNIMNNPEHSVIPSWLHDLFLGYGEAAASQYYKLNTEVKKIDFLDTFMDGEHLKEALPHLKEVNGDMKSGDLITIQFDGDEDKTNVSPEDRNERALVESYTVPRKGPYPEDLPRRNAIRFTPAQVSAIRSGVNPGLTLVVGPPGTGKTDTAVQMISLLLKNFPEQRTLIVAHSNQVLNDLFEKIVNLDVEERYLLRLGAGEKELRMSGGSSKVTRKDLDTANDFSRWGRVDHMLQRRIMLLDRVRKLSNSLEVYGDSSSTCEAAMDFKLLHVDRRIAAFRQRVETCTVSQNRIAEYLRKDRYETLEMKDEVTDEMKDEIEKDVERIHGSVDDGSLSVPAALFPFKAFFNDLPDLFPGGAEEDMASAECCFRYVNGFYEELMECRPFEFLRTMKDRSDYLLTIHSKVIAMTCTHASLVRKQLVNMKFKYDNLLMEESAQILEVETFIPMLLQRTEHGGHTKLKRVILIGDHNQLPPVVKNRAFQQYGRLDQSMFLRFIRLQTPYTLLDQQGRARPSLCDLYRHRYPRLGNLPLVTSNEEYSRGNAGLAFEYQFINCNEPPGEYCPHPHYFQNRAEAELAVGLYVYMRLQGHPAESISILSTYNGQKNLIKEIVDQKCAWNPVIGVPDRITTVDKYQGQQNDYVIVSLVRTQHVGHLRDVRRLVVALSRARLGLYIIGCHPLFKQSPELRPVLSVFERRPLQLVLLPEETHPTQREVGDVPSGGIMITGTTHLWNVCQSAAARMLRREEE